jgi:ABC-type uncharacterized transport system permease subunit
LPRQVEAEIYPKKDPKKVCKILGHSEGASFVAPGGLTRMTCGISIIITSMMIMIMMIYMMMILYTGAHLMMRNPENKQLLTLVGSFTLTSTITAVQYMNIFLTLFSAFFRTGTRIVIIMMILMSMFGMFFSP